MKKVLRIDKKHGVEVVTNDPEMVVRLVKITEDGRHVAVPESEPVILFRGRDYLAVPLLEHYIKLCAADGATDFQLNQMEEMVERFRQFARENPQTMKQPGCTRGL